MATNWFRITYARNAFLRFAASRHLSVEATQLLEARRLMADFCDEFKAQHTAHGGSDTIREGCSDDPAVWWISRHMVRTEPSDARELRLSFGFATAPWPLGASAEEAYRLAARATPTTVSIEQLTPLQLAPPQQMPEQ